MCNRLRFACSSPVPALLNACVKALRKRENTSYRRKGSGMAAALVSTPASGTRAAAHLRPQADRDIPANLDTVRGLACLLVVALHVIGDEPTNGLHLPMSSGWHYAMGSIEFIRIPLFTTLSGFRYAGTRVDRGGIARFWSKKLRRLGVPLLFVSAVVWLLRTKIHAEDVPFADALLYSFGHLWYIQALILLFAAISVWDCASRPGPVALVLAGLAAIMLCQSGLTITRFFSLAGSVYLAPYFLFGILLRTQQAWLHDRRAGTLAGGVAVIVLASQQFGLQGLTSGVSILQLPAALAGMASVVFLLQRLPRMPWLAFTGTYSYTIYLWHVPAGAAMRGVLTHAGIVSVPLLFPLILTVALLAPILLHLLCRRIPLLRAAVTGERALPGAAPWRQHHCVRRHELPSPLTAAVLIRPGQV